MSWVAEEKATSSANAATCARCSVGSIADIPSSPIAIPSCASSIQLLRLPSTRVNTGNGTRSTTGAHSTLTEYVIPTQLKKPMALRLTSSSVNQADRVENTSRKGSPAENPRNSMASTRG
jgi:hypothetical protein